MDQLLRSKYLLLIKTTLEYCTMLPEDRNRPDETYGTVGKFLEDKMFRAAQFIKENDPVLQKLEDQCKHKEDNGKLPNNVDINEGRDWNDPISHFYSEDVRSRLKEYFNAKAMHKEAVKPKWLLVAEMLYLLGVTKEVEVHSGTFTWPEIRSMHKMVVDLVPVEIEVIEE